MYDMGYSLKPPESHTHAVLLSAPFKITSFFGHKMNRTSITQFQTNVFTRVFGNCKETQICFNVLWHKTYRQSKRLHFFKINISIFSLSEKRGFLESLCNANCAHVYLVAFKKRHTKTVNMHNRP